MRFFEIDALRGLAVIAMIAFHVLFALNFLAGYSFDLRNGLFLAIGRFAATAFVFLVGLSLTISYSRARQEKTGSDLFKKYLFRGIKIFCLGLAITGITFLSFPEFAVVFGVLHCIGLSIVIAFPFIRKGRTSLLLGLFLAIAGLWVAEFSFPFPWLLWLGLKPVGFQSFDYFPLLPWFGVILLGIFAGNLLYPNGKRAFQLPGFPPNPVVRLLCFLGRHSLVIYFLHVPVLVAAVQLLA